MRISPPAIRAHDASSMSNRTLALAGRGVRAAGALFALTCAMPAPSAAATFVQTAGESEEIEQRARLTADQRAPGMEQPVQLTAELATALSRGNTETFQITSNARLNWAFADGWVSETRGMALYGESYGENTANSWALFERVDRFLSGRISAFAAAGIERDLFAGIDARYSGQLGAALLAWENRDTAQDLTRDKLSLELGVYAARENYRLAPNAAPDAVLEEDFRNIYAGRAAASYVHAFQKGTTAGVMVEAIQDFNDTDNFVLNDSAYLAAAIVEGLALKVTVSHRFDTQPASADLEKHDVLLTTGLVVSL